ncbi:hypothetical protein [Methanosphaera sp. BMS]|uniref:hypothetical protein n=1 Tax=Methanosphaera sp. BMS TaxID=1789762 RepID=UPI000DC1EC8F|nr:hypothetical protein [Methanosphaera sp. BMS]AWX32109.1 hypothetical protein AW729_02900 [Methanosphaera sp. BMS]
MEKSDKNMDPIFKQIDKMDNKESIEYIYMDDIKDNLINLDKVFDDSFLITRNTENELVMMDNNSNTDEKTLLSFIPEVDLMIIDDKIKLPTDILEQMISKHTIILKIFNKIYYVEDQLKNEVYITTENESLKIMDNGIYTKITQDSI